MAKRDVGLKAVVDGFVAQLQSQLEQAVQEQVQRKLRTFAQGLGSKPMKSRPHQIMKLPCPVEGCKNLGAPRWGMVCKEHVGIPKDKKLVLRQHAKAEGGLWEKYLAKHRTRRPGRPKKADKAA